MDDINIVSEITIGDSLICQVQSRSRNGYVIFEKVRSGYVYCQHFLSSEDIIISNIDINEQFFYVLICNKPHLENVEIVYSNPDSSKVIETKKRELNGNMMCIVESIDASYYVIEATFYDTNGNTFNMENNK